jgi:hypothetical protein
MAERLPGQYVPLGQLGLTPEQLASIAPSFGSNSILDAIERMNMARKKRAEPKPDDTDEIIKRWLQDRYAAHD